MHVGINESWKNGGFAEVMDFVTLGRYFTGRDNGSDPLPVHKYGRRADSVGSDYPASDECLQTQKVISL
jgi:hypothetical protein